MNEQVKRFKPVKIDVASFERLFKNREVRYVVGYNNDGSLNSMQVVINGIGRILGNKELYVRLLPVDKEGELWCKPERLINSGNDFSQ